MKRPPSKWLTLLVSPVLALLSFLFVYARDPLGFGSSQPIAALPAFLLSIVVLTIGQNLSALKELESATAHSDRIYEAVKDYLHVTKVGSPEQALQYIAGRLPSLTEVKNTSFNVAEELERSDEHFYESETYQRMTRQIADACSRNLRWKDVGDQKAVSRLRTTAAAAAAAAGGGRPRSNYQYRIISGDVPQVSFIVLNYPDGSGEVLFNWDFRNIGQDPVVLLSRDRDILEMFSVQFEHLWRSAANDHDSTPTKSTSKK